MPFSLETQKKKKDCPNYVTVISDQDKLLPQLIKNLLLVADK